MHYILTQNNELYHHGIKGQKWGIRRYQNSDGTLTPAGRERYGHNSSRDKKSSEGNDYSWRKESSREKTKRFITGDTDTEREYSKLSDEYDRRYSEIEDKYDLTVEDYKDYYDEKNTKRSKKVAKYFEELGELDEILEKMDNIEENSIGSKEFLDLSKDVILEKKLKPKIEEVNKMSKELKKIDENSNDFHILTKSYKEAVEDITNTILEDFSHEEINKENIEYIVDNLAKYFYDTMFPKK